MIKLQLIYICFLSLSRNPKSNYMSIGKKKFNMDPKKVKFRDFDITKKVKIVFRWDLLFFHR